MAGLLKRIDGAVFVRLLAAGMLGVVAVLPYLFDLLGSLAVDRTATPLPIPVVIALALLQNGILLAAVIAGIAVGGPEAPGRPYDRPTVSALEWPTNRDVGRLGRWRTGGEKGAGRM